MSCWLPCSVPCAGLHALKPQQRATHRRASTLLRCLRPRFPDPQHWPFPSKHVMLGYAYILTHPGIPCLFWEHHFGGLGAAHSGCGCGWAGLGGESAIALCCMSVASLDLG